MLETTIAGSLPKPSWLAKPRMLWAPWQLEGEAFVEAKRDATLLALKEQEPDFGQVIELARSCREQIDWNDVRRRTEASPMAKAFFTLVEELGVAPRAA